MTQHAWHRMKPQEVLEALQADEHGLTLAQVGARRQTHGWNRLPREKVTGTAVIFFRQFVSPLMLVLIIAAVVSVALGEIMDAGVIAAAVLVNTLIGFFQEERASQALQKLQRLVDPRAIVQRQGTHVSITATEIVPGDILILRAGDKVPADARLLEAVGLAANESTLTGESTPIEKTTACSLQDAGVAERTCMVHAGTNITAGRGVAVVVATGHGTQLGQIAALVVGTEESHTPLQEQLHRLARLLAMLVVVIVLVIFFVGMLYGHGFVEMFETSVALAVAAIPEGLLMAVTVTLAIGMQRILKRRALARRLVAAETLGSVSVICTDKTGTITEGKMRVVETIPFGAAKKEDLFEIAMLCNDASVTDSEVFGTSTETALMEVGLHFGLRMHELNRLHPRVEEIPFSSETKYMATLHEWGNGKRELLIKGAPERLLALCDCTSEQAEELKTHSMRFARHGLRVVALARKSWGAKEGSLTAASLSGLTFAGLMALQDPLRPRVAQQIKDAKAAGVRTVMITGDHPDTASFIASEAGLIGNAHEIITGEQLDAWDDATLAREVEKIAVYARVEPRHKIRIVRALQGNGEVVAMTGDGVNDAPALKAADIGIAMGSGTEVAKEASDLVILDDNFETITAAIEEGRIVFDNIRKSTVYLLTGCFTEVVLIAGALFFRLPLPLLAVQILWINLVADSFPNIGLTLEKGEPDVMRQHPRPRGEGVLNRRLLFLVFPVGLATDIILFLLYAWLLRASGDEALARTVVFAGVGIGSIVYVFALRSVRRSVWSMNPLGNPWLLLGVAIGLILMAAALMAPFLRDIFEVSRVPLSAAAILFIMALLKLVAVEVVKSYEHSNVFRKDRKGV